MKTLQIGIVGGSGYSGAELLRLLAAHPAVQIRCITSRAEAGQTASDLFQNLRGTPLEDLRFVAPDQADLARCDCVFFATPHGVAMQQAPALLQAGVKVIDLAADFRLPSAALFERWYKLPHACPDWLERAAYGLPELNRERIRSAQLVANPGCYPTTILLGLSPLLKAGWVDADHLIASAISGVSGAGRKAEIGNLFCEDADNLQAYGLGGHRHQPEAEAQLSLLCNGGAPCRLTFVPHLAPMIRGMFTALYVRLNCAVSDAELQALYEAAYRAEPFVDVLPWQVSPQTRASRGSNMLRLTLMRRPEQSDTLVILVAQDNLTKGAAGQAVQNMNLLFGLDEAAGLDAAALLP